MNLTAYAQDYARIASDCRHHAIIAHHRCSGWHHSVLAAVKARNMSSIVHTYRDMSRLRSIPMSGEGDDKCLSLTKRADLRLFFQHLSPSFI